MMGCEGGPRAKAMDRNSRKCLCLPPWDEEANVEVVL